MIVFRFPLALLRKHVFQWTVMDGINSDAKVPANKLVLGSLISRLPGTYITLVATMFHLRDTWAQCDKSRKSHSMQVSSCADCSLLSYVASAACGHTNWKTRSHIWSDTSEIKCANLLGSETRGTNCGECRARDRSSAFSNALCFFFLLKGHFMMRRIVFASLTIWKRLLDGICNGDTEEWWREAWTQESTPQQSTNLTAKPERVEVAGGYRIQGLPNRWKQHQKVYK